MILFSIHICKRRLLSSAIYLCFSLWLSQSIIFENDQACMNALHCLRGLAAVGYCQGTNFTIRAQEFCNIHNLELFVLFSYRKQSDPFAINMEFPWFPGIFRTKYPISSTTRSPSELVNFERITTKPSSSAPTASQPTEHERCSYASSLHRAQISGHYTVSISHLSASYNEHNSYDCVRRHRCGD